MHNCRPTICKFFATWCISYQRLLFYTSECAINLIYWIYWNHLYSDGSPRLKNHTWNGAWIWVRVTETSVLWGSAQSRSGRGESHHCKVLHPDCRRSRALFSVCKLSQCRQITALSELSSPIVVITPSVSVPSELVCLGTNGCEQVAPRSCGSYVVCECVCR